MWCISYLTVVIETERFYFVLLSTLSLNVVNIGGYYEIGRVCPLFSVCLCTVHVFEVP